MMITKPPMGFNTWNTFGKDINEKLIFEIADTMVECGLVDAGYDYLVIDDCWSEKKRDNNGRLVPDKEKFPHGMKAIADYVHSKGIKFGMYTCCGTLTCAGYPGSYGYEYIDAKTFAEWDVDFLKFDICYRSKLTAMANLYRKMGMALKNSGRDILYSACSWGMDSTVDWIDTSGANMWRATPDIFDSWQNIKELVNKYIEIDRRNYMNCFADLDMLVVGMYGNGNCGLGGCSDDEYKTHFSFWAMMGSPLMIGCDIRNMNDATRNILLNKDVIAINQDCEFNRPYQIVSCDASEDSKDTYTFVKILHNGDIALGIFNFSDEEISRFIALDVLGIELTQECVIKDLWNGETTKIENATISAIVSQHGCKMFRISLV